MRIAPPLVFFILLMYAGPCLGKIITTPDFQVISDTIARADPETLVIFDVDDVLLHPNDQVLKSTHKADFEVFKKRIWKRYPETRAMDLFSLITTQRQNARGRCLILTPIHISDIRV